MADKVQIVDVTLRDGLQNESVVLSVEDRFELAQKLMKAGSKRIEVGAFVREDKVPQMKSSDKLFKQLKQTLKPKDFSLMSALVPNEKGLQEALSLGLKEIAIFTAASESFNQANINCSIEESFNRFKPVLNLAKKNRIKVRGYLSTAFGCPYEGTVSKAKVVKLTQRLLEIGCYEVSIGDTIGVAAAGDVEKMFLLLKKNRVPLNKVAGHFHDTRGTATANALVAYKLGCRVFDATLGGIGGCPYAPGSQGNVGIEDLAYLFESMGVKTSYQMTTLLEANDWLSAIMKKSLPSPVGRAKLLKPLNKK